MSLLLDALKKAERDKQKAREAEVGSVEWDVQPLEQEAVSTESINEVETTSEEILEAEVADSELELALDEPDDIADEVKQSLVEEAELQAKEPPLAPPIALEKSPATTSTVSDEALQLLVHKTNKRYRKKQKMVWGSLLSATIIILMAAGGYYYLGMLEEVDALERKHQLAMRDVRSEPVRQYEVTATNNISEASVIVKHTQGASEIKQKTTEKAARAKSKPVYQAKTNPDFSIRKTKIEDPINALLHAAWQAYNRADYATANQAYENVLNREPKNRDALLGIAAIAVKSEDYKKAKASYQLLLKLNPRDELAMSAVANIEKLSTGDMSESKLKFMLQQQPDATHLNFALGNYYARLGKWPEAQSEYFKAWQGNSKNADYVYNLAVSLDQIGKPKEALRFYKECLLLATSQNTSFSKEIVEKRIHRISDK